METNSMSPDQTAPFGSSLIWVHFVCNSNRREEQMTKVVTGELKVNNIHERIFPFITGLTNKRIKRLEDALDCFYKLHAILRNSPQVIYQIADMYPFLKYNYMELTLLSSGLKELATTARPLRHLKNYSRREIAEDEVRFNKGHNKVVQWSSIKISCSQSFEHAHKTRLDWFSPHTGYCRDRSSMNQTGRNLPFHGMSRS